MDNKENFGSQFFFDASAGDAVGSIITKGFAIIEMPEMLQSEIWYALEKMDAVPVSARREFSFPSVTDGFWSKAESAQNTRKA